MSPKNLPRAARVSNLELANGTTIALDVERWLGPPTAEECEVLERVIPPVLDVGCGPGRHVLACAEKGMIALGLDAAAAIEIALARGAPVLHRSIFASVPGAGRWCSALLLDGNIGIGGDPKALLARVRALLKSGGVLFVEVEGPGTRSYTTAARVAADGNRSEWFPWAIVGSDSLSHVARAAGFCPPTKWERQGRWFAALQAS